MQIQTQLRPTRSMTTEPTDEALAARIAQRDADAFESLYIRYARLVYVLAAHLLGDGPAEEIVQDVFMRLWKKANQFDARQGLFRHWFMAIARNCVMDELRRRKQRMRVVVAEEIEDLLANWEDTNANVDDQVWSHQRAEAVVKALQTLPPEQRQVIVIAYFGGFTQAEIAQQLQLPLGTVKKRIRLGLQKVRAHLAENHAPIDELLASRPSDKE